MHQGVGKIPGGLHGGIAGGLFWHRRLVREELGGLGFTFDAGLWNVDQVASVVFRSSIDVPAVYTMWCPGAAIGLGVSGGARGVRLN